MRHTMAFVCCLVIWHDCIGQYLAEVTAVAFFVVLVLLLCYFISEG